MDWAKVLIIALVVAFFVVANDIRINGVRFGLEQIAVMYAGIAMGMWAVSSTRKD